MTSASRDILMVTLDALRFDTAERCFREARTPNLAQRIPQGWEPRHTPGSFTYAAHAAFFAGFWPTPIHCGTHTRPFALRFPGSRSQGPNTLKLAGSNIVEGLRERGYQTICIGGVGFFNPDHPLGAVFPSYFEVSHWRPEFGVTELNSARAQIGQAVESLAACDPERPVFLFLNISATHSPTRGYVPGAKEESVDTQCAALESVDRQLPRLFAALSARGRNGAAYLMSDHGTLFGEDGLVGHRVGHTAVWTVPYAEFTWERAA
jgi:hypothetical protein